MERSRRRRWRRQAKLPSGQLPLRPAAPPSRRARRARIVGRPPERVLRAGRRDRPIGQLPSVGVRVAILGGLAVAIFAVILFRLWFLQILSGQQYVAAANDNRLRSIKIAAPRGLILDRSGKTILVGNRPALAIGVRLMDVPAGELAVTLQRLAGVLKTPVAGLRETLARHAGYGVIVLARDVDQDVIARIRQSIGSDDGILVKGATLSSGTNPAVVAKNGTVGVDVLKLKDGKLARVLTSLAAALEVRPDELLETLVRRAGHEYDLVVVQHDAKQGVADQILERRQSFRGVEVRQDYLRSYPLGTVGAHLYGNVGEVTAEELANGQYADRQPGDMVGHAGVEYTYDHWLRGRDGKVTVQVDSFGRPKKGVQGGRLAQPGDNLVLSVDAKVQKATERALVYGIETAHRNHLWRADGGAAVVMDVRSGELIAMASYPTFDPRVWQSGTAKDFKRLASKGANYPLVNRAQLGSYPAGSIFKVIDAVAGLENGVITPYQTFYCNGTFTFKGWKDQTWKCWRYPAGHGNVNVVRALEESCDVFFYNVGLAFNNRPGTELADWALRLGLGKATGSDIPGEAVGRVPTPAWKQQHFEKGTWDYDWHPGDSINLAIGQGFLEVTPLQMAVAYAAIANGGSIVTPHVGLKVVDSAGRLVKRIVSPAPRRVQISRSTLNLVRQGLRLAASSQVGTSAPVFAGYPIAVAGKTGTAEWGSKDPIAWYASYAPANDPKYVVIVMIEQGGHGGAAAAPAARLIYDALFNVHAGAAAGTRPSD